MGEVSRMSFRKAFLIIFFLALPAGCAPGVDYHALENQMRTGQCDGATGYVEGMKDKYGNNQRLIFHMDMGMLSLYCGDYRKSTANFQAAEDIASDLWTQSVTREGVSFLTNDYTKPYAGEDFEKVMINLFSSISFALDGDYESALVEARKLNEFLVEINEKYEKKSIYREDAFARYMSAMLYEAYDPRNIQNLDSATIDYELGYPVYGDYYEQYGTPVPEVFTADYFRVAEAAGRLDDARAKRKQRDWLRHGKARAMGRIVLLHLSGKAPVKVEEAIVAHAPFGPIKVAFPRFVSPSSGCQASSLLAERDDGSSFSSGTELVEDLSAIAMKNLDDRRGRVVAKAIARAVAKQAAINAISNQGNDKGDKLALKLLGRVVAAATEKADTRSWRTLPDRIYMTRMFVPEGSYNIKADFCGNSRALADNVRIEAGQTRFVLLQDVY